MLIDNWRAKWCFVKRFIAFLTQFCRKGWQYLGRYLEWISDWRDCLEVCSRFLLLSWISGTITWFYRQSNAALEWNDAPLRVKQVFLFGPIISDIFVSWWGKRMWTEQIFGRTREQINARPETEGRGLHLLESSHKRLRGLHKQVQTRKTSFISFIK